jgi:hypothetical protein
MGLRRVGCNPSTRVDVLVFFFFFPFLKKEEDVLVHGELEKPPCNSKFQHSLNRRYRRIVSPSLFVPPWQYGILVCHPHRSSESFPLPATPRRCSGAGLGSFRQSDSIRGPRRTASPAPPRSACLSRHESRLIPLDRMSPRGGYEVWPAVRWDTPLSPRLLHACTSPAGVPAARSLAIRLGLGACCPRAGARESPAAAARSALRSAAGQRARSGRPPILPGPAGGSKRAAHPSPDPFQATVLRTGKGKACS